MSVFFQRLNSPDLEIHPVEHLAILFLLNTFVRSSEMRCARWQEINFDTAMWEIPPTRKPIVIKRGGKLTTVKHSERGSKMKTVHLVPLSRQALSYLKQLKAMRSNCTLKDVIFFKPTNQNLPMCENRINTILRSMGYHTRNDVCAHGFRTMACSTLVESGFWTTDAIERQMSHQERSNVRSAYTHKAEKIHERKQLMQWWSDYLDAVKGEFVEPYEFAVLPKQV